MVIRDDALERMLSGIYNFSFSQEQENYHENMRSEFADYFNIEKVKNLREDEYFLGKGKKRGCIAYELEWTTRELGSIKGGSALKFGYEEDFRKIKQLLIELLDFNDKRQEFYNKNGELTAKAKTLCELSKEINGFKSGRTVLPKLLSIYYSKSFLPLFNDADSLLEQILVDYKPNNIGLDLYLECNLLLLQVKKELSRLSDEDINSFSSYKFMYFLYHCFPKNLTKISTESVPMVDIGKEPEFDALEVQHYQSLIHRNFKELFPKLEYFEPESQITKNGQYDTQTVGIMDFLAVDKNTKDLVVIELKRKASDRTIGQLARYMGWVKDELCKPGQQVRGIILAEYGDNYLTFALKVFEQVEFKRVELDIKVTN